MSVATLVCRDCDITFTETSKYKKHLSSIKHLTNITNIPINELQKEENDSLKLDPYLNTEDIKKIQNDSLGEGISIQFKNDTTLNVKYNNEYYNEVKEEVVKEEVVKEEVVKEEVVIPAPIKEKIVVTQKQIQIIKFLITFQNHQDMSTKFYKILQTINAKDLNKLDTHIISTNHIELKNKQKVIKIFNIFKNNLQKLKEKGNLEYNNNNIDELINLITL
jgi:hypothetical protein